MGGLVVTAVLFIAACGAASDATVSSNTAQPATQGQAGVDRFCTALVQASASGDAGSASDQAFLDALDLAPAELSAVVTTLKSAKHSATDFATLQASQDLMVWAGDNCRRGEAPIRHVAPATTPDGFVSCGDSAAFPAPPTEKLKGSLVIYGDGSLADPYGARLVAVLTGMRMEPQDSPRTDVTINGLPGVTGPAGVFQGGGGPGLSRLVAWTVEGHDITVFGRGYGENQADELLALAQDVKLVDGQARLSGSNMDVLYSGPADPISAIIPFFMGGANYSLTYQRSDGGGQLNVVGLTMDAQVFAATRAFFFSSALRKFDRGDGFVADAWGDTGPFVAAWREPDGVVVWVVGIGSSKAETVGAAEASKELSTDQWKQTSRLSPNCNQDPTSSPDQSTVGT